MNFSQEINQISEGEKKNHWTIFISW